MEPEHVNTDEHTDRNTNNKVRARCWIGTWNGFPENWKTFFESNTQTQEYIAQEEIGEKEENLHIQFAVKFKDAKKFNVVRGYFPGAHIEVAKNWNACANYCSKIATATGDKIEKYEEEELDAEDPMAGFELRPIQQDILNVVNGARDRRAVHWFYDPIGNMGKTSIALHICLHNKDVLYLTGKSADMKYGVSTYIEERRRKTKKRRVKIKAVIIDLTRQIENFVSYQGIEEIKNGIFYSTKYESGMVMFDYPHVIILANFMPDMSKLSADRWRIHQYGDDKGKEEEYINV